MTKVMTGSGVELEADRHTIRRVRARAWQVAVVVVCVLAGVGLVAGWLIACTIAGCDGVSHKVHKGHEGREGERQWMVENWAAGRYANEMAEFEEVGQ